MKVLKADTGMGIHDFAVFAASMGSRQREVKEAAGLVNACMLWNLGVVLESLQEARRILGDGALGPDLTRDAEGFERLYGAWEAELGCG